MKLRNTLMVAAAALMMAACDPGFEEDIVLSNSTSHSVTIVPSGDSEVTLAAGEEKVIKHRDGLGGASLEFGINAFAWYYGDSVVVRFDNSRQVTYHKDDTTGISPYNFSGQNYTYEEKRKESSPFKGNPYYGKLTFSITDEHYGAAQ